MNLLYKSDDDCACSYIDTDFNYYLVRLQGKITDKDYKSVYSAILESCQTNPYKKIVISIIDNENSPMSVPFSARSWFASYFIPKFYNLSEKDITAAIVKPQTKLQANMINVIIGLMDKTNIKIKAEYFENEEKAKEWIKNPVFV